MADTGWLNPSGCGLYIDEWTDPTNVYASDTNYATLEDGLAEDYFSYGFNLPAGAIINGIEVQVQAKAESSGDFDLAVELTKGDTKVLDTFDDSEAYHSVGGASDLWGTTWTYEDFAEEDPGDFISTFTCVGITGTYGYVNNIQIKVYYTESSSSSSCVSVSQTKSSTSSSSISVSVTKSSESSSSVSISQTKSSTSSSSISISQTKSSASSSCISISQTKSSTSSSSISVTKSSSSQSSSNWIDPDASWLNPTEYGYNYDEWDSGDEALVADKTYATAIHSGPTEEDFYNFGFSIPVGATIDGIEVRMKAKAEPGETVQFGVQLSKGDTKYFSNFTYDTYHVVGGASDLWGTTWAYTDFTNDHNFLVTVWVEDAGGGDYSYIDVVQIKVHYTESSSSSSVSISQTKSSTSSSSISVSISVTKSSASSQSSVSSLSSNSISQTKSSSSSSLSYNKDLGWLNPSNSGYYDDDWTDAFEAYAQDDQYAFVDLTGAFTEDFYDYGFSIPASATIDGIEVRIKAKPDEGEQVVFGVSLPKGDNKIFPSTDVDEYYYVGGASDLWGTTWTPADFTDDPVNFFMSFWISDAGSGINAYVDNVQIKVHYTESSSSSSSVSISATKTSSSVSISQTKSSSSLSQCSKSSASDSVSSSLSVSVSKTSSSISVSISLSVSVSKTSSSLSVSWTLSSSSISISVTSSSRSSSSFSATKSSLSSLSSSATKSSSSSSFSQFDIGRTVLKLAWGTRIVNFSHLEVNTVQIGTFKKLDLQRLQNRQPVVYELGTSWKIIDVILDGYMSAMTMDKLEAIRKVTSIMTMTLYYSDGTTQAEQYSVRIDPGAKSHYLAGNRSAQDQLGVVFYEAQSA